MHWQLCCMLAAGRLKGQSWEDKTVGDTDGEEHHNPYTARLQLGKGETGAPEAPEFYQSIRPEQGLEMLELLPSQR